jgi:hypothetical protein
MPDVFNGSLDTHLVLKELDQLFALSLPDFELDASINISSEFSMEDDHIGFLAVSRRRCRQNIGWDGRQT